MNKIELIKELDRISEIVKPFNKFIHLFSKDEGKKTMAELNRAIHRIKFLLHIQTMKEVLHPKNKPMRRPLFDRQGQLVRVMPCAEKYEKKTFLGFLVGELAMGSEISITEDKIQLGWTHYNPAIFVPELGEIIMGCESWWSEIKSEEELKQITDTEIENVWYVKMLKNLNS